MKQIIKEKISLLEERYQRRLSHCYNREFSAGLREFWKRQAEITKEQIELLKETLATKELENN